MKKLSLFLILAAIAWICSVAYADVGPNWIEQYGIRWTFDKNISSDGAGDTYHYGQFFNGDYWIIGPVRIESVSPPTMTQDGVRVNGSQINPVNMAAYDSRVNRYDSTQEVQFPIFIDYNASIASSISRQPYTSYATANSQCIQSISVLTVLLSAPEQGRVAFRPPLIGPDKTLRYTDEIIWKNLPTIGHGGIALPSADSIQSNYVDWLRRPWILHSSGYGEWSSAPVENMPGYHQYIARILSHAAVYTLLDWGDRTELVQNYIQVSLEYHAMQVQGLAGPRATYFWPTTFAGIMLGDDNMRDLFKLGNQRVNDYHRDKVYFRQRSSLVSLKHPAISPSGVILGGNTLYGKDTWTGYYARTGRRPVFYSPQEYYEETHPDEWSGANTYNRMHSIGTVGFTIGMWAFGDVHYPGVNLDGDHAYAEYAIKWMFDNDDVIIDTLTEASSPASSLWPPSHPKSTNSHGYATSRSGIVDALWRKYEDNITEFVFGGIKGVDGNHTDTTETEANKTFFVYNNIIKSNSSQQVSMRVVMVAAGDLRIIIYDHKGKEIKTIFNGATDPGISVYKWHGDDNKGNNVGSGVYMVHMRAGSYKETKKIVVVK